MQENSFSEGKRRCSVCTEFKDIKNFYTSKRAKSGYRSECKYCHGLSVKIYYRDNLERCRSYAREYYAKNKEEISRKAKLVYHEMKNEK
jgi:hypothetical protein